MIYILVPVFRRLHKTTLFIETVSKTVKQPYEIIVLDDSPGLEHYNHYSISDESITVLKGTGDLFWGGGINKCISYLLNVRDPKPDDIIVFANNDVLLGEDTFDVLFSILKKDNNVILHPRLYNEHDLEIPAGSFVSLWFPFITKKSTSDRSNALFLVDLASARFLMFTAKTLVQLERINPRLRHYGGDNDFTLRAKKLGILTYIVQNAYCQVDESDTGIKAGNINNISKLVKSFYSLKSPNSIKQRYIFISSHFNKFQSIAIVTSMSINSILKFTFSRFRTKLF